MGCDCLTAEKQLPTTYILQLAYYIVYSNFEYAMWFNYSGIDNTTGNS